MTATTPVLTIDGAVARIILNRPAQRNRLQDDDLDALLAQFAQVEADTTVRVLVLTANTHGQPRPVFCAGYDLGGFSQGEGKPERFEHVPDALAKLRPITLCALNGSVYGGATDLVLACDLVLAQTGIEFKMPAAAIGLHYYPTGLARYVHRLGLAGAKRAFLTGQPLGDEQLDQLGLLTARAEPEAFDTEVERWVHHVADLAPLAAQGMKQSLNEIAANGFDAEADARLRGRCRDSQATADFAAAMAAIELKRKPRFTGQ